MGAHKTKPKKTANKAHKIFKGQDNTQQPRQIFSLIDDKMPVIEYQTSNFMQSGTKPSALKSLSNK